MQEVGHAALAIIPSFKGFEGNLERGSSKAMLAAGTSGGTQFGDAAGKSAGTRFGSAFKSAAKAGLVGLAALGVGAVKLAADSVSAASDLEESTNKVAQVFGKGSEQVFRFSEKAADALGQTNEQARNAAATFGIFGSAAGLADRQNAKFSKRMVTLASDLASFNNTDPSQAVEALGAALRGESEPIRAYGVMLDEATLKAEALALGILKPVKNQSQIQAYQVAVMEGQKKYNDAVKEYGKESLEALKAEASLGTSRDRLKKATEGTIEPLTQQQKLLAAQSQIFKQTEVAQGDFARTSDGLANQQRRLAARFEDAKAKLGKGLLPIMTQAADLLLDKGIPAFERFSDWFNKDGIPAIKEFREDAKPVVGLVKDLAGAFNDLPTGGKIASLGGALAGGLVIKHQMGKLFERGGIANPMFVVVTNPGGLPGGSPKTPPIIPTGGIPGAVPKVFGTLPKYAKFGALPGIGSAPGQDSLMKDLFGFGLSGSGGLKPGTDAQWDALVAAKDAEGKLDGLISKAGVFGKELDLIGAKKIDPSLTVPGLDKARENMQKFLAQKIKASEPITPYVALNGYDRTMQQIATLNSALHALPGAGIGDGGAVFLSGGAQRAGVVNNFNGPMHVTDGKDITRQAQRKAQERGLGGRPE